MFEKRLPGCCVWECELLLTAKKLFEASGAACSQKAKAATPEIRSFHCYWIGRCHRFDSSLEFGKELTLIRDVEMMKLVT